MKTEKRRVGGLFRTFGFGIALAMYSSGLTALAEQPREIPQPPTVGPLPKVVAPPDAGALPPATNTGPAIGREDGAFTVPPECACCSSCFDPISQVPNFLGDFVARPSQALIDQPRISTLGANGTANANTLTFFGLPIDVAGGIGKQNIFYAPFLPPGIVGPGGPYRIFTDVTGFGVPPGISILK